MIKQNEIRVGNWFSHNSEWSYRNKEGYFQWDSTDWYALGECTMDLENIETIPLTPEILEKAGFIKVGEEYQGTDPAPFPLFRCKYHSRVKMMYVKSHSPFGKLPWFHVEYVHQFQNICFALTGEELEIKL